MRTTTFGTLRRVLVGGVLAFALAAGVQAADHFVDGTLSDSKGGEDTDLFKPDTAKIFYAADLDDVADGAKVTGAWVAEKTDAAPPNYKIDATDLAITGGINHVDFSISKPNAGWPVGDYRLDLSVNGKVVQQVKFKVAK